VNTGDRIRVYELSAEVPGGLSVELEETVVAVPAGASRSIRVRAVADRESTFDFAVNVRSEGQLVQRQTFTAHVEGRPAFTANATILLTVILAIIFVVLLVVLIVLLTRKPEKTEEFGESYY
jgi:hypothetical protein